MLPWSGRKSKAELQRNVSGAMGNTRNMLIIVENHTPHTLLFFDSKFIDGKFLDEIDFELPGMHETGFTVRNSGLRLKGVTGSLFFRFLGHVVELYFSNNLIGVNNGNFFFVPTIGAKSPLNGDYQLSTTVGTGNSGSIWTYSIRTVPESSKHVPFHGYGLLTLNVASFPPALPTIPEPKERCEKIARYLLKKRDVHLCCFQEAWFTQSRKALMNILIREFPFIVDIGQVGMITFQTNGLLIASKAPVVRSRFFEFGNCIGADGLSRKGLLAAQLHIPSEYPYQLCVFTTHLQADPDPSPPWLLVTGNKLEKVKEVRYRQCQMVREFIHNFVDPLAHTKVLLCGDFNVPGETEEYFRMLDALKRPTDVFRVHNPDDPGHTWDYETNKLIFNDTTKARYDYVFEFDIPPLNTHPHQRQIANSAIKAVEMERLDWSDHYGVFSIHSLRPELL